MKAVRGPSDHVVVVGAGLSGLSAALHLLGEGRSVTVVEAAQAPGGRAGLDDMSGYRIDTGPTVLTPPDQRRRMPRAEIRTPLVHVRAPYQRKRVAETRFGCESLPGLGGACPGTAGDGLLGTHFAASRTTYGEKKPPTWTLTSVTGQ
ncbi:FAD-dependent oxidoreductase [Streptomyces reniochalinae]|uniref:FAD-dependent oxidoreductase n=1 Tax=Streptomyces reniochalinae TaxID=2250578 RepID=A0A367EA13_9ACTN|nr:FAD-dependent oxidoreductase [Streptomyces reniochalinae]